MLVVTQSDADRVHVLVPVHRMETKLSSTAWEKCTDYT